MSMNVPPEDLNQQPVVDNTVAAQPDVAVPQEAAAPVEQAEVAQVEQAAPATPEEQQLQEQQAVQEIGQAIADEQISARDILRAVISDSIGLSPAGADSLIDIFMSDLINDEVAAQDAAVVPEQEVQSDVPPQV